MKNRQAHGHEALYQTQLSDAADRLEQIRSVVERSNTDSRLDLERALDVARGLRNRGLARIEAARHASDDTQSFARTQANQTINELLHAIKELEQRLSHTVA